MIRSFLTFSFLYAIVFVTGAAGLIYEVTWQKYLGRLLGSDSIATAIILATFLGGLSLGYYLCGKFSTRIRNHFKAYALAEGIIGAWCLCFPSIFKAVESFTQYWSFSPPVTIIVQGVFCSTLLMGIPTVCMGSTIPFLTRGLSRNVGEATHVHASIYAINTAGAFLGTLLAGFYLIPEYGLPLTVMGTAFLNMGACLFFYLLAVLRGEEPEAQEPVPGDNGVATDRNEHAEPRYSPLLLYVIAFLSGFYVMTLENVLIRISNLSLGSSSYSFSLVVSVFILSIAIGSHIVGRLKQIHNRMLFMNQLFITLSLLIIYIYLDTWPYWAHFIRIAFKSNIASFWIYYACVFSTLLVVLILPLGLMGATVPIAFHEIKRDLKNVGKHSGLLFSLNTMGNLTGSLIGGVIFYYFMNNAGIFLTAILLAAVSTCLSGRNLPRPYFLSALVLTCLIFIFSLFTPYYNQNNFKAGTFRHRDPLPYSLGGPADFFKEFYKIHEVKYYKDGPAATVSVLNFPKKTPPIGENSISVFVNGKSDSSTSSDVYTLKLSAHLPALLAEKRENIMVVGLGTGVTVGELTLYPDAKNIDVAEISPSVVEAFPYFEKFTYNAHKNPNVRVHIGDAFRILARSQKKWDIIVSEPSNPWVTGVDLLFTKEFYKLAKEHLTESGILLQWAQMYSATPAMLGMIVNTVQQEFKASHIFMANTGDLLIVGSNKEFSIKDIENAEEMLRSNEQVKASLGQIGLESVESILIREVWPPSYISDNFSKFGIQTMDNPRLHYMAGKSFFMGRALPADFLFNSSSAAYYQDYLIARKYENWTDFPFSEEMFHFLMLSLKDKVFREDLPMVKGLKLKASLSNPDLYPLSEKEKKSFRTDIVPFIASFPQNEEDWDNINLKGASFREKAGVLFSHVSQFRNWIVPYPIDGLKKLLQEGISKGKDAQERNWCSQNLALLLSREKMERSK